MPRRRAHALIRPGVVHPGKQNGWESLTPTETKIAGLIADGRSNPQIAAELSLSGGTVRAHVSRILAKFGVRSRTEIAAFPVPGNQTRRQVP